MNPSPAHTHFLSPSLHHFSFSPASRPEEEPCFAAHFMPAKTFSIQSVPLFSRQPSTPLSFCCSRAPHIMPINTPPISPALLVIFSILRKQKSHYLFFFLRIAMTSLSFSPPSITLSFIIPLSHLAVTHQSHHHHHRSCCSYKGYSGSSRWRNEDSILRNQRW